MTQKVINYAKVLCDLEVDRSELAQVQVVVAETPALYEALVCPVVSKQEKADVIDKVFAVQKQTTNFLKVLCKNSDFALLSEICKAYDTLAKQKADILPATLFYVTPPTEEQKKGIEEFLKREYQKPEVELMLERDDRLLGGFVIRVGNLEYDWSIAGRCRRLTQRLVAR